MGRLAYDPDRKPERTCGRIRKNPGEEGRRDDRMVHEELVDIDPSLCKYSNFAPVVIGCVVMSFGQFA